MTVLVGVRCTDGVVIGADSMATSSFQQGGLTGTPMDKIAIIGNKAILAGTGAMGLGQRFESIIETHIGKKTFATNSMVEACRVVAHEAMNNFLSTGAATPQKGPSYGSMLAVASESQGQLVEFEYGTFQPEIKKGKLFSVSMGSGQQLAEPFLAFVSRVLWSNSPPDVKTAKFGVLWSLEHCIKYAPGGVGHPINIAVLVKDGSEWKAKLLEPDDFDEQRQHIEAIEAKIAEYPVSLLNQVAAQTPPEPPGKA